MRSLDAVAVAIIVPTRHEAANVVELHRQLVDALGDGDWTVWFVDDSDDETVAAITQMQRTQPEVRLIHREPHERAGGLGGAVLQGLRAAADEADVLIVMDADLQHPVDAVPRLIDAVYERYADVVVASRYTGGGSAAGLAGALRQSISRGSRHLAAASLPRLRSVSDPLSGFFALRPSVIRDVEFQPDGYKILMEILVRGRWLRVSEVPYVFAPRVHGESKLSFAEGGRFLRHVVTLRSAAAARLDESHPDLESDSPLRILILTSEAPPVVSGISRSVGTLTDGLRARGHHVDVVSRADFPRLARREIRISTFGFYWPQFRRLLSQYDLVNVHGPVPTISETFLWLMRGWSAANRPGVVYTHHSDLAIPGLEQWCEVYNRSTRNLAHSADAIVVTSSHYRDKLSDAPEVRGFSPQSRPAPVHVIPWVVDVEGKLKPHTPPIAGALRALFVGQLRPYKGLDELFTAVAAAPTVHLTVVGDGPMRRALEGKIVQGCLSNIRMLGRITDAELWQSYAEADVVVLPSTTTAEAFGLVLVEGMAAGCVPVASDLPGVRGVAGPTGVLVPPGDATALREALELLATDHNRLLELSSASQAQAGCHRITEMLDSYEQVFQTAAATTSNRQSAAMTPAAWPDPDAFLQEVNATLGSSRASLTLVGPGGDHGRVWRHGKSASMQHAPVATYVARRQTPLLIDGAPQEPGLQALLRRSEVTSSLLVPVPLGRGHVAVLGASTDTDTEHRLGAHHIDAARRLLDFAPAGGLEAGLNARRFQARRAPSVALAVSTVSRRPLRLAIDGRVLVPRYNGIGRVVYELLREMVKRDDVDIKLLVGDEVAVHFDLATLAASGRLEVIRTDVPLFGPSHLWKLESELKALRPDAVFYPFHLAAPIGPGIPRIVMVHDCTFETDPAYFPGPRWKLAGYRAVTKTIISGATEVLTGSSAAAGEIRRFYGRNIDDDSVAHHGVDPTFLDLRQPAVSIRERFGLPERYLLTVGARRPHKNLAVLMRAMTELPEDVHLVCVGWIDDRFPDPVPALVDDLGIGHRIHHFPTVDEAELLELYAEATAFLYPSKVEGFGLPLLEAMASGVPIVASAIPVFAEVARDAALYASPDEPAGWAHAVCNLLDEAELRDGLVERGRDQASRFTWKRASDRVLEAVKRAAT